MMTRLGRFCHNAATAYYVQASRPLYQAHQHGSHHPRIDRLMEARMSALKALALTCGFIVVGSLAGCASSNGPTQVGFAGGNDCRSVRAELNKLDGMGVPGKIEAKQAGRQLSADANQQVNRYNALLEQYLGNQCQLPPA
jgi:hypothetical protein